MPRRKENYIVVEQSVTVGPAEVDALVTQIGEALQLHGSGKAAAGGGKAAAPRQRSYCTRLRGVSRASPYHIPGSSGERDWDQIRPWTRKRIGVEEDDPRALLQDLILSGNLIKEAVRRLQFSAAERADFPRTADTLPCA